MTRRGTAGLVLVGTVLLVGGAGAYKLRGSSAGMLATDEVTVPTTRVIRGALEVVVHTNGELRASKSAMLSAPPVAGGTLRLVTMADAGLPVHTGDVVMEFDPTEQQYLLEQALSQLAESDQEIAKLKADQEVQAAQDKVDLLGARFDVRRAQLDAIPDRDLIAPNEYQRRQLSLEEAKRKLTQIEEGGKSRVETSRASLAVATEKRTKSKMAADRAQMNIASLVVKSPIDGFLVPRENRDAAGGFFYSGMSLPGYRAGDNVYPGRPVADVFDISQMEVRGQINEQQRMNVMAGQSAEVVSNALPTVPLTAKVTSVSGSATQSDFFGGSSGPLRQFDVLLKIDQADSRLRPGSSVQIVLAGSRIENVLNIPRQALFEKNGKPVIYARAGDHFEARVVKPTHRTEGRVAVEKGSGIDEGLEIALVNPDLLLKTSTKAPGKAAAPGVAK